MKLLINISLYLFAALLSFGLALPALIHAVIDRIRYKSKGRVSDSFLRGAYSLDVYGNNTYYSFLNAYFLKKGGYHFGKEGETISSALGKNWTLRKLTVIGQGCAGLLNWIDTDHCYNAIDSTTWNAPKPDRVEGWKTILFAIILMSIIFSLIRFLYFICFGS